MFDILDLFPKPRPKIPDFQDAGERVVLSKAHYNHILSWAETALKYCQLFGAYTAWKDRIPEGVMEKLRMLVHSCPLKKSDQLDGMEDWLIRIADNKQLDVRDRMQAIEYRTAMFSKPVNRYDEKDIKNYLKTLEERR